MHDTPTETLYTTSGAARALLTSEATVRAKVDRGVIKALRDSSGRRLITQSEIDRLRGAERSGGE